MLPFANLSADKENEYFSDGLAEEILNLLTRIPGLKVIARMSSFAFRGKEQDIAKIAAALGVQNVLEGSVRRSGNRVRVTAQLIQASDCTHLWSERYDRDMTDVFAIQDEIGQAISTALQVRLAPRTRVVNVEAWEHWLKGVYYRARNSPDNFAKAKDVHFEQALAIDPSDSESYTVLACAAGLFDHDWERAGNNFAKAVSVENVSPRARFCYGMHYLSICGRMSEAIEQERLALQSDPLSMLFNSGLIWCLIRDGQHAEAIACGRRALAIDQNFHLAWMNMGLAQLAANLPDDAVSSFKRMMELAPWVHIGPGCLAAAYHCAGDRARGADLLGVKIRPPGRSQCRPRDLCMGWRVRRMRCSKRWTARGSGAICSCLQCRRCRFSIRTARNRATTTCLDG